MTAFYTRRDVTWLEERAMQRGDLPVDLVLCSDGIMRTAAEREQFEKHAEANAMRRILGMF